MALSDIINKILEEAQKKAAEILKAAEEEIAKYKTEIEQDKKQQEVEFLEKMDLKKKNIDRKMDTTINMEERNQVLKVKQSLIHETFDKAVEAICKVADSEYKTILENLLKASSIQDYKSGSLVPAKGKSAVTKELVAKINPQITVMEEGDFKGGFIFQGDKLEIDSTIESIVLKNLKPSIESDVAKLLF